MSKLFDTVESAIEDIRNGKMIIVTDDEDRENEGDLVCAAEKITPEHIVFMATHARGLICTPITEARAKELGIARPPSTDMFHTAFTESVDSKLGTTTGISAFDRAKTALDLIDPARQGIRFRPSGSHVPHRGTAGRRTSENRTHGSRGRSGAARRTQARRSHLRNYERRRSDGTA